MLICMADLQYDITRLPDYPALQQLARALWRNGSVRGASILVGAGLSKNAQRPGDDTSEPPLWWELLREMIGQLYPHNEQAAPSNPLRIAEEYRTYFGQAALDDFLRTRFPDRSWSPGPLHTALLELPWTDVLTTNWDTLLERAAEHLMDYSYEIARAESDLTHARSPRIVKLHGTIGDPGPLIFAEEDYRTYPTKHAAFVNFARQVFIENELCLIGFSGDDPNFLQWAGWVRDHLGGSARRIYLVGNLHLEWATRKYLEARNIAPIDFAPLVKDLSKKLQHEMATRIFIDELRRAKPPPPHEWMLTPSDQYPLIRSGGGAYQRVHTDHTLAAKLLRETIPLFKVDRENYPGWLLCPLRYRHSMVHAGDTNWLVRKSVLELLDQKERATALFEILWRRTTALFPLDPQLVTAMAELVDGNSAEIDLDLRLEFALALMRDARVSHDDEGLKRFGAIIETESAADAPIRQEAEYQWCLRARDQMDLATMARRLIKITADDPVWKLRRAALHTELAEYAKATQLMKEAAFDFERRYKLDRNSLSVKSHLAWASWISRASLGWATGPASARRPRDFRESNIDPLAEIEYIESKAAEIEKKRKEDAAAVQPAFEAGHYRDGSTKIHIGPGDPGLILLYEFDQLVELTGLPLRINHVNVSAEAATAAVEVAHSSDVEWYVWLVRALHSHLDRAFERHFSRLAVARMPMAVSSALISVVESAVAFWARRFKDVRGPDLQEDFRRAADILRLLLVTFSRLTVRMSPDQAANALNRACDMAKDAQVSHYWLIEALGELVKHAAAAVPKAQQGALALAVVEFPLPSEKGAQQSPTWPQVVTDIWDARPIRDLTDGRWDHRIRQLTASAEKGKADRVPATLCLAYLALAGVLTSTESKKFGETLWSDVDEQDDPLPVNTGLNLGAFLKLPAPADIDVQARLEARLLNVDLREAMRPPPLTGTIAITTKIDPLASLLSATQRGLTFPAERAVQMFDEIVVWEPQEIDQRSPFAASISKQFNDGMRFSAGSLLATAIVPAMQNDQRTEQRARNLIVFIERAHSWTGISALLPFLPGSQGLTDDIISIIRAGLLGSEYQHVANAATAISEWSKPACDGALPKLPRSLIEQLIGAIETREIGLQATLYTARALMKDDCLLAEDIKRLVQAVSRIWQEFRYENVDADSMKAVSASLVRAECVKLAAALKDRVTDGGALQAFLDEAKDDPLPEVRFSLADV
jgi:hypothetical protein